MNKCLVLFVFVVSSLLGGCFSNEPYSQGEDYLQLPGFEKSKSKQVVLFFSAACPHCFKFDKVFEPWVKQRDPNIIVERIPVNFGHNSWKSLQKVYAAMRKMEIENKLTPDLFEAVQEKNFYLGDEKAFGKWMTMFGFKQEKAQQAYTSEDVNNLLKAYYAAERRFNVRAIPKVVINGLYEIKIKSLKGKTMEEKLVSLNNIISYLIEK